MRMNRALMMLVLLLFLMPLALAQTADWVPVDIRSNWQQTSIGFCAKPSQCLVSNAFNTTRDNIPDAYWDGIIDPSLGPKCIDNGQYILDHYCMNGQWTSRTRLVATQLLGIALDRSPQNFSLYCDDFHNVLNRYGYSTDFGNVVDFLGRVCPQSGFLPESARIDRCINSMCVLNYGSAVAIGTSVNALIDGEKSTLQAFNRDSTQCANAINNQGTFQPCGADFWYNHPEGALVYTPGVITLPNPAALADDFFLIPYNKLHDYVFTYVHNPAVQQYNYQFFNATPDFSYVYLAKNGFNLAYAFKQTNVTYNQIDYAGWYFSNMGLTNSTCLHIVKAFDSRANCEHQPNPNEFYIVASRTPSVFLPSQSIVDNWAEVTKLRVVP